jgi:hypothetical protein
MSNRNDDLRSTEESIRQDAREIERLEDEKQAMPAGDPRLGSVSGRVERVSGELRDKASTERALAEESGEAGEEDW